MIYFTNYIPIEGEIKEGDIVSHENGRSILKVRRIGDYTIGGLVISSVIPHFKKLIGKTTGGQVPKKHCKKVSLHLCIRNGEINKGDVYQWHNNGQICTADGQLDILNAHLKNGDIIKVIGRISPDATWVTEGMELDKENLEERLILDENEKFGSKLLIFVKGPCGHYH